MATRVSFSLTAARREADVPECIVIENRGEEFQIPAELPLDIFDPVVSGHVDLESVITQVTPLLKRPDVEWIDVVADLVGGDPSLPTDILAALKGVVARFFGDTPGEDGAPSNYQRWLATTPSINDYGRLLAFLREAYGVGLGESLRSSDSPTSDGTTSKETSSVTAESTPEAPGADQDSSPDSSESDD